MLPMWIRLNSATDGGDSCVTVELVRCLIRIQVIRRQKALTNSILRAQRLSTELRATVYAGNVSKRLYV